jgi:hypothetical protein
MTRDIYELAKFMHEEYENAAKIFQWKTQKDCQVEWIDLPQANKDTMMFVAEKVIDYIEKSHDTPSKASVLKEGK